ncbi:insulinase family protein [Limibacter armeniacum]|uniref:M16 family metallopeptidase n=1 Tax=Limibacter armeniacum TaxID=466084 RepID=UPI002FE6010F
MNRIIEFWCKLTFLIAVLTISCPIFGQDLSLRDDITTGKLKNGFTYYLVPEGEPGKVRIRMVANVGSQVETYEERGVAHLLEHMIFKGTKSFPGEKSKEAFDQLGLRFGGDYNATTNSTFTNYRFQIPSNNNEHLRQNLFLLKEMMFDIQMEQEAFEVEKKVVIEEINRGETSDASPYLINTALEGHNGIGTIADIENKTLKGVQDFYDKYYTPDQLALIIYGDVDPKIAKKYIKKIYGKVAPAAHPLDPETKYIDLTKQTVVSGQYELSRNHKPTLVLAFKEREGEKGTYAAFKKELVDNIFCSILEHRLKNTEKKLSRTTISTSTLVPGNNLYNLRLQADKMSYSEMLEAFCQVVAQARKGGFDQREIDFYVNLRLSRFEEAINRKERVSIDALQNAFLKGEPLQTPKAAYELMAKVGNALKPADFTELLSTFTTYPKTILFDETQDAYTPNFDEALILEKIAKINDLDVAPFEYVEPVRKFAKRQVEVVQAEVNIEDRKAAAIVKRIPLGENLYQLKYKNGASVVVYNSPIAPTMIKLMGKDGLNTIPKEDRALFSKTYKYLTGSFGTYSNSEAYTLRKQLMVKDDESVSAYGYEFALTGKPESAVQMIQLFNLYLTASQQEETNAFLKSADRQLSKTSHVDAYEPFKEMVTMQGIETEEVNAKLDEAVMNRLFSYNEQLKKNIGNAIIYVSGDLPENIDELISKYIGTIKGEKPQRFEEQVANDVIHPKGIIKKDFPWGKDICLVDYLFNKTSAQALSFKEDMVNKVLKQYAWEKLLEIIRKKYGLVYAMGSTSETTTYPTNFQYTSIRYMIDEKNIIKAHNIMVEEVLGPMSRGEISDKDVEKLKAMMESLYLMSFYDTKRLEGEYLQQGLKYGKLLTRAEIKETIQSISADEFRAFMKEMIDLDHYFLLIKKPNINN